MNKKQKNNTYAITFTAAARRLGVSISTVQRLVRKGTLHTTEPQLRRHHWTRGIRVDKAFEDERARRLNGLKAPRKKHIPDTDSVQREFVRKAREQNRNDICEHWSKDDPSPIQTVTPPAEPQPATEEDYNRFFAELRGESTKQESELTQATLERAESAMHICLKAEKACQESVEEVHIACSLCSKFKSICEESMRLCKLYRNGALKSELAHTRCTAILAAACILQLLLAAYYTLCHFNVL